MTQALLRVDRVGFPDISEIFTGRSARPVKRRGAQPFADFVGTGIDRPALRDRRDCLVVCNRNNRRGCRQ
jgi:hypothetical protein